MDKKKRVEKEVIDKKISFSILEIALIKISVFFFTLFLVAFFPSFFSDLDDWKWAFLVISVLLGAKPFLRYFKK